MDKDAGIDRTVWLRNRPRMGAGIQNLGFGTGLLEREGEESRGGDKEWVGGCYLDDGRGANRGTGARALPTPL